MTNDLADNLREEIKTLKDDNKELQHQLDDLRKKNEILRYQLRCNERFNT